MLHTWAGVCPAPCRDLSPETLPFIPEGSGSPFSLTKAGKAPSTEHSGSASWLRILRDESQRLSQLPASPLILAVVRPQLNLLRPFPADPGFESFHLSVRNQVCAVSRSSLQALGSAFIWEKMGALSLTWKALIPSHFEAHK